MPSEPGHLPFAAFAGPDVDEGCSLRSRRRCPVACGTRYRRPSARDTRSWRGPAGGVAFRSAHTGSCHHCRTGQVQWLRRRLWIVPISRRARVRQHRARAEGQPSSRPAWSCASSSGSALVTVVHKMSRSMSKYACTSRFLMPVTALQGTPGSPPWLLPTACSRPLLRSPLRDQSEEQHLVGVEISTLTTLGEAQRRFHGVDHVTNANRVIPRHTAVPPRAPLRP